MARGAQGLKLTSVRSAVEKLSENRNTLQPQTHKGLTDMQREMVERWAATASGTLGAVRGSVACSCHPSFPDGLSAARDIKSLCGLEPRDQGLLNHFTFDISDQLLFVINIISVAFRLRGKLMIIIFQLSG